jgi:hypothetical protein
LFHASTTRPRPPRSVRGRGPLVAPQTAQYIALGRKIVAPIVEARGV